MSLRRSSFRTRRLGGTRPRVRVRVRVRDRVRDRVRVRAALKCLLELEARLVTGERLELDLDLGELARAAALLLVRVVNGGLLGDGLAVGHLVKGRVRVMG